MLILKIIIILFSIMFIRSLSFFIKKTKKKRFIEEMGKEKKRSPAFYSLRLKIEIVLFLFIYHFKKSRKNLLLFFSNFILILLNYLVN